MGLDITAYSKLTPVDETEACHLVVSECQLGWTERHFPGRSEGVYEGRYTADEINEFRAGSYSGYGQWRDWLAKLAGWGDRAEDCWNSSKNGGPFYELINFADNAGVIGPIVAAKLARDFAEYVSKVPASDEYFRSLYVKWKDACEIAADGGAIVFH